MIKFFIIAAVLAVTGYVIFIPIYSYLAAAVVTVLVEGFMLIATIYLLKKYLGLRINLLIFGKAMLAAVVMGFLLSWWVEWNVVLLVIMGAIVYLGVLWLIKGIDKNLIQEFISK